MNSSRWKPANTAASSRPRWTPARAACRSSPVSVAPPASVAYAQEAERLGAKGLLLLPHYLTEASQDGVAAHVEAVCKSVKIGVVVYNRNVCRLQPHHLEQLAERCPNLIGYKDGLGDIELMVAIRRRLGDRFSYLGGLPTAEVYAAAYKALGVPVYSSAVFNFVPKTAVQFYEAEQRPVAAIAKCSSDTRATGHHRLCWARGVPGAGGGWGTQCGLCVGPVRASACNATRRRSTGPNSRRR